MPLKKNKAIFGYGIITDRHAGLPDKDDVING